MQDGWRAFDRKKRDAPDGPMVQGVGMERKLLFDDAQAWDAVLRRDRRWDGRFVTGVLSTGIYCRPSCAARHPARSNVRFFADGNAAREAGLRPCLRCRPDSVARDEVAVRRAVELLEGEAPPALETLAAEVGYAPHHFSRLFRRATGVTPAAYVRARKARRAEEALAAGERVTDAIYDAGYGAPSRFYARSRERLGMAPSAWRDGGTGMVIRWAVGQTTLGPILVAATDAGICRLAFDTGPEDLARRFPRAEILPGGAGLSALLADAIAAVENPAQMPDLPLDVRGTAFQEAVWRELSRTPPGETVSYAALAARAGNGKAVRAAGSACGANPVAVLIPCHRARRSDGAPGGYAWGLDRKQALLARERSTKS